MTVAGTATLWIVFSYKHQNWSIYAFGVLWMTSEQRGPPGRKGGRIGFPGDLDLVLLSFRVVVIGTRRLTMSDTLLFRTNTGLARHESTFVGAVVDTKFVTRSRASC